MFVDTREYDEDIKRKFKQHSLDVLRERVDYKMRNLFVLNIIPGIFTTELKMDRFEIRNEKTGDYNITEILLPQYDGTFTPVDGLITERIKIKDMKAVSADKKETP